MLYVYIYIYIWYDVSYLFLFVRSGSVILVSSNSIRTAMSMGSAMIASESRSTSFDIVLEDGTSKRMNAYARKMCIPSIQFIRRVLESLLTALRTIWLSPRTEAAAADFWLHEPEFTSIPQANPLGYQAKLLKCGFWKTRGVFHGPSIVGWSAWARHTTDDQLECWMKTGASLTCNPMVSMWLLGHALRNVSVGLLKPPTYINFSERSNNTDNEKQRNYNGGYFMWCVFCCEGMGGGVPNLNTSRGKRYRRRKGSTLRCVCFWCWAVSVAGDSMG